MQQQQAQQQQAQQQQAQQQQAQQLQAQQQQAQQARPAIPSGYAAQPQYMTPQQLASTQVTRACVGAGTGALENMPYVLVPQR